ncbi:hypothetical protein [Enhydrobacter aerosaccus]|nr:hypothetical protein [Enhydrobacter aerosaccus]
MATLFSPSAFTPAERERLRGRFFSLIWDQLRPWAYMDTDGLEIRRFDGTTIAFEPCMFDGAPRQALWDSNYIEPFLEEICRDEAARARAFSRADRTSLREVLLAGIKRVYLTMQEIDWHMQGDGVAEHYDKHDVEPGIAYMTAYLDHCLAGTVASAA